MLRKLVLSAILAFSAPLVFANEKLTVMLDWFVNPDQAPLIIGVQEGFFSKEGLDVSLIEPSDTSIAPRMAAAKKVDLAFDNAPNFLLQLQAGLPLIKVSTEIDTPLNNLLVRKDSGIKTLADLKGKTIGYSVPGFDDTIMGAMLKSDGLTLKDVNMVNVNWALVQSLMSKKVDAVIGAYRIFENIELEQKGVEPLAFYFEEHGVPTYDEMILVANKDLQHDPRFAKFNQAMAEATVWMLNHPDDAWKSFLSYKDGLDTPLNKASWAAVLPRFSADPGAINRERYQTLAKFMADNGLLKAIPEITFYSQD